MQPSKFIVAKQKLREFFDNSAKTEDPEFLQEIKQQQQTKANFVKTNIDYLDVYTVEVLRAYRNYQQYL
jgi:hypothetical protein